MKKNNTLEFQKNIPKDAFTTTIYLPEMNFIKNNTEPFQELRQIKIKKYTLEITWRIVRKCLTYNCNIIKCYLCQNKKLEIALYEGKNLLDKKTELIWCHPITTYAKFSEKLISFFKFLIINCHCLKVFRNRNQITFLKDIAFLTSLINSIAICGCLKCSFSSSGSFGFCQTFA